MYLFILMLFTIKDVIRYLQKGGTLYITQQSMRINMTDPMFSDNAQLQYNYLTDL